MTKKLFSLRDQTAKDLERLAKETELTQSQIVEGALTMYILLGVNDPENLSHLQAIMNKTNGSLYDLVKDLKQKAIENEFKRKL